ncbi:NifU family protein [Mesorhizobium sp. AaZ16]|uniref:NifU family protein n=1 Tax=Mesorhizobium sp. AaZ16 TaxID=3402289 RepID=UPI00374FB641
MGSYLRADGSDCECDCDCDCDCDCELVNVEDDQVYVKLSGACAGFQLPSVTINGMRQRLNEATSLTLRVVPVN